MVGGQTFGPAELGAATPQEFLNRITTHCESAFRARPAAPNRDQLIRYFKNEARSADYNGIPNFVLNDEIRNAYTPSATQLTNAVRNTPILPHYLGRLQSIDDLRQRLAHVVWYTTEPLIASNREAGIDLGGPRKEFLTLLAKEIKENYFKPSGRYFHLAHKPEATHPDPLTADLLTRCTEVSHRNSQACFENIGKTLGKLIFVENDGLADIELSPYLIQRILGEELQHMTLVERLGLLMVQDPGQFHTVMDTFGIEQESSPGAGDGLASLYVGFDNLIPGATDDMDHTNVYFHQFLTVGYNLRGMNVNHSLLGEADAREEGFLTGLKAFFNPDFMISLRFAPPVGSAFGEILSRDIGLIFAGAPISLDELMANMRVTGHRASFSLRGIDSRTPLY